MFRLAALVLPLAGLIVPLVVAAAEPALPRVYTDTTYVSPTGNTTAVAAGGDFQAVLIAARPGHMYRRNITLHNEYGVKGSGSGVGIPTLARYFACAIFEGIVLVGRPGPSADT